MNQLKRYSPSIIRWGLAVVFFANAYTAWFMPDEFKEILTHSFLSGILPFGTMSLIIIIGISDSLVAALLLFGRWTKIVSVYAFIWILGVILISQPSAIPDTFEHIGFLAMSLYLWVNN